MPRILVVDDEVGVQESLRLLLKGEADVETVGDVAAALVAIRRNPPDLVLLDLVMPGRSGLDLLAEFEEIGFDAPVIVLTATNTVDAAVEAMKRGARDFVTKPFELEALRLKVRQLLEHRSLEHEVARLREEVERRQRLCDLVGRSEAMRDVFRTVERVASAKATVLITGESGTGKELVARAIHQLSDRRDGPMIAVNCGAIPHELIESELFGHEKGAFTGASERRIGRFEAADGGTLFLDEIGDLEQSVQVKLLRALQERVIERVGSTESRAIDVRVLAATNRDLEKDVADGRFRQDLFYRINVVPVALPPLRERRDDIRLLATTFLKRLGTERTLSEAVLRTFESYPWPGNVRELENAIEHGVALADGDVIEVEDLPTSISKTGATESLRGEWRSGRAGFDDLVARFETELLREALERHGWNQTRASESLGITRRVLKLKMDRYQIEPPHSVDD